MVGKSGQGAEELSEQSGGAPSSGVDAWGGVAVIGSRAISNCPSNRLDTNEPRVDDLGANLAFGSSGGRFDGNEFGSVQVGSTDH